MPTMNEKDYYAILGVSKDADAKQIQKAFQQKARSSIPMSTRPRTPRRSSRRSPRPTRALR